MQARMRVENVGAGLVPAQPDCRQASLRDKVLKTVEKYKMLESGDRVLVAVSGGQDSSFLLWVLHSIGFSQLSPYNLEIRVAHMNHCLRARAWEEADFVRAQSDRLGIPCSIEEQDVKSYCSLHKLSLEDGARKLRYDFLERLASAYGMNKIATGHTADDQVETFILRVARGCGGRGLLLIPPKRKLKTEDRRQKTEIIRPLIEVSRNEIRTFLDTEEIAYRVDETNYDCSNVRNYVRHHIVPKLREVSSDFSSKVIRLREILAEEELVLEQVTKDRLKEIQDSRFKIKDFGDGIVLNLDGFLATPLAIKRRLLREIIAGELRITNYPNFEEIENAIRYIENSKGGKEFNLRGIKIIKNGGVIRITDYRLPITDYCIELSVPGKVEVNEYKIKSNPVRNSFLNGTKIKDNDNRREFFDLSKLELPLFIRSKRRGDRIKISSKTKDQKPKICTKKLKDMFIDDKVPVWERGNIPLLVDGDGILWVVGRRRAHRALVEEGTTDVVEVCIEE